MRYIVETNFDWDPEKDAANQVKHGVPFREAQRAFADPKRIFQADAAHSAGEMRFFCMGKVDGRVLMVRFTYRRDVIRIYGAGHWRKGVRHYEKENQIHPNAEGS
jgi:uncharacterized DUF497 family protein